jgi:hypothetical protein
LDVTVLYSSILKGKTSGKNLFMNPANCPLKATMGCHWTSAMPKAFCILVLSKLPRWSTGRRHLQARIKAREDWPIMTDVLPPSLHQRNIDDCLQAPHWRKSHLPITRTLVTVRRLSFLFDVSQWNKWRLYPLDPGLKCRLFQVESPSPSHCS